MNKLESKHNENSYSSLKKFVKDLDIPSMELNPKEISLNELASIGALLQVHAENLYARAKLVKAKGDLDKDIEVFKQYQDGAFDEKLPKGKKVERIISSERIERINQDIKEGEKYAEMMIVKPHGEGADFAIAGFWQEKVLEFLKDVALNFIIGVLRGMIKDAIPSMIEIANKFIDNLENKIVDLYNQANEEEQRIFKENIRQNFPNSRLLEKLN